MTDSEIIVLFALAMLALALVAIAVDWVGKPIHRRFVPKIYRYPEELAPPPDPTRTEWSDDTFRVPENPPDDEPMAFLDGSTEWTGAELVIPEPEAGAPVPLFDEFRDFRAVEPALVANGDDDPFFEANGETPAGTDGDGDGDGDEDEDESGTHAEPTDQPVPAAVGATVSEPDEPADPQGPAASRHHLPERIDGWRPGQYVYNRTRTGNEPSPDVIRRRFWRNIGSSDHAVAFGALNASRLSEGRPPVRHNPRLGATETMSLPVRDFETARGKAPSPAWPDDDIDPYA